MILNLRNISGPPSDASPAHGSAFFVGVIARRGFLLRDFAKVVIPPSRIPAPEADMSSQDDTARDATMGNRPYLATHTTARHSKMLVPLGCLTRDLAR